MKIIEIQDPDQARLHLLQGLWLARAASPDPASAELALAWSMEIAGGDNALPPIGFVSDVGQVALGAVQTEDESPVIPGLDSSVIRKYEDYVLGKLYADMTFERGVDALLRYQGRDRDRGLAYLINQLNDRCDFGGTLMSPAVIKSLQQQPADEVLAEGWQSLDEHGILPQVLDEFERLIAAVQSTGVLLASEDIFELEHGTALAGFGQRIALRQLLQAAAELQESLPRQKPASTVKYHQVATHILDEDSYPVGGFSSISTRGSIESLLHSQLAYIEPDQRPDLFDIKFLRDELLYYSRDENQFLRRRQTFVFALYPDLIQARVKDAELPWQRIVLVLALVLVATRKLIEWLSHDSLRFEFLFLQHGDATRLDDERELLEMVLREEIANGTAELEDLPVTDLRRRCESHARRSQCHCLTLSSQRRSVTSDLLSIAHLRIDGPRPALTAGAKPDWQADGPAGEAWHEAVKRLLQAWV